MNEIFQYFADVLLVAMRDALILLLDKFLKVKLGCSLALAIPYTRQKLDPIHTMPVRNSANNITVKMFRQTVMKRLRVPTAPRR